MIDALELYGRMIGVSIRAQMQYRASFLLMSVGHFITTAVEMLGIWALFDRFGNLLPWTLPQVAFFYGVVNISFAFTDALARGFDLFGAQFIKTGNFDRVLLRPRSTVLQLAGHEFTLFRVGRLLQGIIVLAWASQQLALEWDVARGALLAFTMLATFFFFYGLVILGAVMSFWTTESLEIMNMLTYGGVETAQYPMAVYQKYFQRFFTFVIPLAMVTYFPILAVLDIPDPLGTTRTWQMVAPIAGFVFFGACLLMWRVGVRHYTSTGS